MLPKHPHIVNALGFQQYKSDDHKYIILELCDRSLHDEIKMNEGLNLSQFKELLKCFASGLKFLRANHIVHGDIKPKNVLMSSGKFKLGDFGLSIIATPDSRLQKASGTFSYCHPAVFKMMYWVQIGYLSEPKCDLPYNIDLYSTGVTVFESITCKLPFRATDHKKMYMLLKNKKHHIRGTEVKGANFYFDGLPPCSIKFDFATGEAVHSLIQKLLAHEEDEMIPFDNFVVKCAALIK